VATSYYSVASNMCWTRPGPLLFRYAPISIECNPNILRSKEHRGRGVGAVAFRGGVEGSFDIDGFGVKGGRFEMREENGRSVSKLDRI